MSVIAIALIAAFVSVLSVIEIPKMVRGCFYKELILFSVILLIGAAAGILISIDFKVPNPSDVIAFFLSPIVMAVKSFLG